jgi:hypothetical protein
MEVYAGIYAQEPQIAKRRDLRPKMPIYRGKADLDTYAVSFEIPANSGAKQLKV